MATTYHEATKTLPVQVPVIATGTVFDRYLKAARQNIENMLRLAHGLNDAEFTAEAQGILDAFDSAAIGALELIGDANANEQAFNAASGDNFWRESIFADRAGLAQ